MRRQIKLAQGEQQALYAFCSKSNRVARGDACSERAAPCAECAPSLCPFAPVPARPARRRPTASGQPLLARRGPLNPTMAIASLVAHAAATGGHVGHDGGVLGERPHAAFHL